MLLNRHGRRLAGGAHHANAVCALFDMPIYESTQSWVINAAVFEHWRDQGHDACTYGFHLGWYDNKVKVVILAFPCRIRAACKACCAVFVGEHSNHALDIPVR